MHCLSLMNVKTIGDFMKNSNSIEPTVILNKNDEYGFLDFNSSDDLSQVIKALKKLIKEDGSDV